MAPSVSRNALQLVTVLAVSLTLAACQGKTANFLSNDPMQTASTGGTEPSFKRTEDLKTQWEAHPNDKAIGLAYAESLGALGESDAQYAVLLKLAQSHPLDGVLLAAAGKQALAAGKNDEAAQLLERAAALPGADWRAVSALGSAYDQQGNHAAARAKYQAALKLGATELSVGNNMAMSYALEGKLPEAEQRLRGLVSQPGSAAIPKMRQNLALVVGLQGRFDEAREIASKDLPPDQVEANLAILQDMLAQPNTWAELSDKQG